VAAAQRAGWPVVLKIQAPDITHKSDVGGVRLGLADEAAVRAAYADIMIAVGRARPAARIEGVSVQAMIRRPHARELMAGSVRDRVFGPAISFGSGGIAVEVHADRAIELPPLNALLAAELIDGTRAARMLREFRGWPAVNREALVAVLLRVSELVCELPQVQELDINPLLADADGVIALDARVIIAAYPAAGRRYDHLAIHPYPAELERKWHLADGRTVRVRPIRPEDAAIEQAFVSELSAESRYFRFMGTMRELTPSMLARFTQIDYDREMAFIVVVEEGGVEREIAVARYMTNPDGVSCEFAVTVADRWQRHGLGRRLMQALIEHASACGLKRMISDILAANAKMIALAERLGFSITHRAESPGMLRAEITLAAGAEAD
jgi:acetyltransferase